MGIDQDGLQVRIVVRPAVQEEDARMGGHGHPDFIGQLQASASLEILLVEEDLYVAEEISANQFKVAGGSPWMKVSWQVTGVRWDPWANTYRIPVEEEKPHDVQGFYLHPKLYDQLESRDIIWAQHPEAMRHATHLKSIE